MTASATHKQAQMAQFWTRVGAAFLPFADAASETLPLSRLLRLSLFQISVGMALALTMGSLNRVMIIELGVPAWLVAVMISLPLAAAPLRALIGHKSDTHRSVLGWRRSPYIWLGALLQFSGFAIMPFALLILSGDNLDTVSGPTYQLIGQLSAGLAFLLVGTGLHMSQTAGLALAADIAPDDSRPRVVALLYVMLLAGMGVSAVIFGLLLRDYTPLRLVQVVQGAAAASVILNLVALWKQEVRNPALTKTDRKTPSFKESWGRLMAIPNAKRLLTAIGLGAMAFSMQDVLLEPYGGEILTLSVSATSALTGIFAAGALIGFAVAARGLTHGGNAHRLAGFGAMIGAFAFAAVVLADPMNSPLLFRIGVAFIGLGGGIFSVCTLTAVMAFATQIESGIMLGVWGAIQATAAGAGVAIGGILRDALGALAAQGALGPALTTPATGYLFVYHIEILLLFATVIAIGPLARFNATDGAKSSAKFGLAAFPG